MDWFKGECEPETMVKTPIQLIGVSYGFPAIFPWKTHWFRQNLPTNKSESEHRRKDSCFQQNASLILLVEFHRIWNKKKGYPKCRPGGNWSTGPCWATASMVASEAKELFTGPMTSAGRASSTAWASSHPAPDAPELSWLTTSALGSLGLMVAAHIYRIYSSWWLLTSWSSHQTWQCAIPTLLIDKLGTFLKLNEPRRLRDVHQKGRLSNPLFQCPC